MSWGAREGTVVHSDRMLKAARAVAGCREPSAEQLRVARHMAREGRHYREVAAFLGWANVHEDTMVNRLKKFNIRCKPAFKTIRHGDLTTLGYYATHAVGGQSYRPRQVRP